MVAKVEIIGQRNNCPLHAVKVEEVPGKVYIWENDLAQRQEQLREKYGDQRAGPSPDDREEFNQPFLLDTPLLVQRWIAEAQCRGATHLVVTFSSLDNTPYPIYVMPGDDLRQKVLQAESPRSVFSLKERDRD